MGHVSGHKRSIRLGTYLKNAVSNAKRFVVNKYVGNISPSALISNFGSTSVNTGNIKSVNTLLKKSPFEINKDKRNIKDDPLKFQHLQYPPELTGNELGNWILFFTVSSNIGDNPAENMDLQLARDLGLSPGATTITSEGGANVEGVYDEMREMYKKQRIDIPRINKTNTVLRDDATKDVISGAIALYMPPDISVSYGAGWGPDEMGISGDIANAYKEIKNENLKGWDAVSEARRHGVGIGVQKSKELLSALTGGAGMGDWAKLLGKGMGLAINNHAEMLYEGPAFREFTYSFRFWPRNSDETKKIQDIILMFKYHMHPGKNKNAWHKGRMFDYPSEFEIHYLHRTGINSALNKISRCALKKCDVKYTPSESTNFKTFEDHNPVAYQIDLTFAELEYMTKDKIKEGF